MAPERTAGDFGKILREARERKGATLRQIASATKISITVLEGLERNDISRLPGGIFGRAFVRAFASEVGVEPEAAIKQFTAQFASESFPVTGQPQVENRTPLWTGHRIALTVIGVIFVVGLVAALTIYLTFGRVAAVVSLSDVPAVEPVPAATAGAVAAVSDAPATDSVPPAITAARMDAAAAAVDPRRLAVSLTVSRRCWVLAAVDGRKEIGRVLQPGDRRDLEVGHDLVLTVGDAGAVALTINGAHARPLGRSGEVVKARLDLNNFTNFLPAR